MLFDRDIDTMFDESWRVEDGGKAIAIVIDNQVVHTMAIKLAFHELLLKMPYTLDIEERTVVDLTDVVVEDSSSQNMAYVLNFINGSEVVDQITTSQEIVRAALLSDPKIVVLRPEVKKLGVEPNWTYIDGVFTKPSNIE